jgi:hypothetical protein
MSTTTPANPILLVARLTAGTFSNADGHKLFEALRTALSEQGGAVTLDLTDTVSFSTSFLNSSFGALANELGATSYQRLRLTNYKLAQFKQLTAYLAAVTPPAA